MRRNPPRGVMVEIGGRRLHAVWAGPEASDRPTIVLEHGAFGCASDWAVVQARLADKGLRSLAYDRAGLGLSDPGPVPRDGQAIVADLAALLDAQGETRPVVLVGHSMGGLMVRLFALTYPGRVSGLVLVDAITPEVMQSRLGAAAVRTFGRMMRVVSHGARLGLMRPMAVVAGDRIGLTPDASMEKRHIFGSASHARWSWAEVDSWPVTSDQAGRVALPTETPVAVITAGVQPGAAPMKALQTAPATASRHGYVEHVAGAGHASLLGLRFADPVVRGVEHVLAGLGR